MTTKTLETLRTYTEEFAKKFRDENESQIQQPCKINIVFLNKHHEFIYSKISFNIQGRSLYTVDSYAKYKNESEISNRICNDTDEWINYLLTYTTIKSKNIINASINKKIIGKTTPALVKTINKHFELQRKYQELQQTYNQDIDEVKKFLESIENKEEVKRWAHKTWQL